MKDGLEIIDKNEKKSNLGIQDYLSLGYVYLLVLGVFHETIYYKFLDINILEYSSVLDVLISPVSIIGSNLWLGLILLVGVVLSYLFKYLMPLHYKYLAKKEKYQLGKDKVKLEQANLDLENGKTIIFLIVYMVFSIFIGMGFGRGIKAKRLINENTIKFTHELIFDDNKTKKIKMLGKNTLYVFYVTEGKGEVSISPIDGNIKTIKKLKKVEKTND